MTPFAIFVIGLMVTGLTAYAVVLVGLGEANDPAHSRIEDLTEWEKKSQVVDRVEPTEGEAGT